MNFQRIARQFYLGHTGGLKFKFHFYNVQDATVKYIPPTATIRSSTAPPQVVAAFAEPSANNVYDEWITRNNYPWDDTLTGDVYSPPFIETGTWTKPYLALPDNVASETISTTQIQIECTIPNMNNLEFIGDKTWFQDSAGDTGYVPYSSAMGDFVLTSLIRNSAESTIPSVKSRVVIYMSYADEARMGYNVCSPVVRVPALLTNVDVLPISYENAYDGSQYVPTTQRTNVVSGAAYIGSRY